MDVPDIQLVPGIPLCAGCVWALQVPSTLITIQPPSGGEYTIVAGMSTTLAKVCDAVNRGATLLLDRRETTFYAITALHGTPACRLCLQTAVQTHADLW